MSTEQALQLLYMHAIQSRLLPPAALPELQKAAEILANALKEANNAVSGS
jgi:hypothetical protein